MSRRTCAAHLFAILACLAGCAEPYVPNLDSSGTTIVCYGDSITAGVGSGSAPGYPELLAASLGVPVINEGVSGDTTQSAEKRLGDVLSHDPWLVIIELGGNDLLQQIPIERTEETLDRIIASVVDAGAVPMLIEIHGPFGGRYSDLFDRLEERFSVPVVRDVLPDILSNRSLKADTIHPNARGYERLAAAVEKRVRRLMARREAA